MSHKRRYPTQAYPGQPNEPAAVSPSTFGPGGHMTPTTPFPPSGGVSHTPTPFSSGPSVPMWSPSGHSVSSPAQFSPSSTPPSSSPFGGPSTTSPPTLPYGGPPTIPTLGAPPTGSWSHPPTLSPPTMGQTSPRGAPPTSSPPLGRSYPPSAYPPPPSPTSTSPPTTPFSPYAYSTYSSHDDQPPTADTTADAYNQALDQTEGQFQHLSVSESVGTSTPLGNPTGPPPSSFTPATVPAHSRSSYPTPSYAPAATSHPSFPIHPQEITKPLPEAQCPEKYFRMTINALPATNSLLSKSNIPLGCILYPLATPESPEELTPLVNMGAVGIVRCRRCRSYINPFVHFIEGGRRWRCNICELLNEVSSEYFCPLDPATGRRSDANERPELSRGIVEYVAPSEYMVRPPMPPVYFFLLDVSYHSISTGMLQSAIETIKNCLDSLPGTVRTQVGFLTYDTTVHFYHLKSSLSQPHQLVVTEVDNIFLPLPDDMLVNLHDSRHLIDKLLDKLPTMFLNTQDINSALGAALKAAFSIMRPIGGKLLIFQSTLPSSGPHPLPRRDNASLLGTDKETSLLLPSPSEQFYKNFALDCSRVQISVDLFAFSGTYADIATLGQMSQLTGGETYYYPGFRKERDGEKFEKDLIRNLTRTTGFEAVMRLRTGKGLKAVAHHGNFFVRSVDLLALPSVDEDKAYTIQLQITDNIASEKEIPLQAALLYTTSSGERRIRVHTVCLPVTSSMADIYKHADIDAILNLTSKMAIDQALNYKLSDAREAILNKCIDILTTYRSSFSDASVPSPSSPQLLIPESLRLLPLYTLALLKHTIFRAGNTTFPDERAYAFMRLKMMSCHLSTPFIYPRLFCLSNIQEEHGVEGENGQIVLPPILNLSSENIDRRAIYLIENGLKLFMWIGKSVPSSVIQALFDVPSLDGIEEIVLPQIDTPLSIRVFNIIQTVRSQRSHFLQLQIVREGQPKGDEEFFSYLVEDKTKFLSSYNEFVTQLQRQINRK